MRFRCNLLVLLCFLAMPAVPALADTVIFDSYDPFSGTRQFTVFNEFTPDFDPETGILTFREVIAVAIGLDERFFALGTTRVAAPPEQGHWASEIVDRDYWNGTGSHTQTGPFTFDGQPSSAAGLFGDFDSVFNPDGIQFSRGAMFFDNEGPTTNYYIAPGETEDGFFAYGPPESPPPQFPNGDASLASSFSAFSPPFTHTPTAAAALIQTTVYSADSNGDGEVDDPEDWVKQSSSIDPPVFLNTVIPLPSAAWMGLGLLGLLAFRRRVRLNRA